MSGLGWIVGRTESTRDKINKSKTGLNSAQRDIKRQLLKNNTSIREKKARAVTLVKQGKRQDAEALAKEILELERENKRLTADHATFGKSKSELEGIQRQRLKYEVVVSTGEAFERAIDPVQGTSVMDGIANATHARAANKEYSTMVDRSLQEAYEEDEEEEYEEDEEVQKEEKRKTRSDRALDSLMDSIYVQAEVSMPTVGTSLPPLVHASPRLPASPSPVLVGLSSSSATSSSLSSSSPSSPSPSSSFSYHKPANSPGSSFSLGAAPPVRRSSPLSFSSSSPPEIDTTPPVVFPSVPPSKPSVLPASWEELEARFRNLKPGNDI